MADEPKPPYVVFENREQEDRDTSIAAGHYVGKDVIFAVVTPAGTRDRIERNADEWLQSIEEGVKQERIPGFWLDGFRTRLKNFQESRETPDEGTPIINWPGPSPAQTKLLLDINIRTVEDLANANEETIMRIGMGGRSLKQKAMAYLEASEGPGKVAAELEALRMQVAELLQRDTEREAELAKIKASSTEKVD